MRVWYAVDDNGESYFYEKKPSRIGNGNMSGEDGYWIDEGGKLLDLDLLVDDWPFSVLLPYLTWADEPVELEITVRRVEEVA